MSEWDDPQRRAEEGIDDGGKSPGEHAYEAWRAATQAKGIDVDPWDCLPGYDQAAWEATVQAVLDAAFPGLKRQRGELAATVKAQADEIGSLRQALAQAQARLAREDDL